MIDKKVKVMVPAGEQAPGFQMKKLDGGVESLGDILSFVQHHKES